MPTFVGTLSADNHSGPEEVMYGLDSFDTLTFTGDGPSSLYGGAGSDFLAGGPGDDYLEGGQDPDGLFGGLGNDALYGGDGNDVGFFRFVALAFPLGLSGGEGDDFIDGGRGSDRLDGGAGNDRLFGSEDDDSGIFLDSRSLPHSAGLFGGVGADHLDGGAGDDWLFGGEGADLMIGGFGNDLYEVDSASDALFEFAWQGTDVAFTYADFTLPDQVENLVMVYGNQSYGYGNGGDNIIVGNASANVLEGRGGYDMLTGGEGSDLFVVNPSFGVDVITDFVAGLGTEDAIHFSTQIFTRFDQVVSNAAQVGADTWIGDGFGNTIVLLNVQLSSLHQDDFAFF